MGTATTTTLEDQYILIRSNYAALLAKCANEAQSNALASALVTCRTNYWTAISTVLHDDDPTVQALTTQMNTDQLSLKATIDHLDDIAKVLDALTKAVAVGSQLAAKAVAL